MPEGIHIYMMVTDKKIDQYFGYRSRLSKQKREDQDEYDDIYEEEEDDDDDSNDSFCIKATKQEAEEWLECIAYLQFYNYNLNGVQMLLDAANVSYLL